MPADSTVDARSASTAGASATDAGAAMAAKGGLADDFVITNPEGDANAGEESSQGITDVERQKLADVIARRLGARVQDDSAGRLASAYLRAAERHAFVRTTESGPVPTSLNVERSSVLIEISRQLGRVIEDFEIRALFRVTATQARAMRTTLLATYGDVTDELTLTWSLIGHAVTSAGSSENLSGQRKIKLADADRLTAFVEQCRRAGIDVTVVDGDADNPHLVIVEETYLDLL